MVDPEMIFLAQFIASRSFLDFLWLNSLNFSLNPMILSSGSIELFLINLINHKSLIIPKNCIFSVLWGLKKLVKNLYYVESPIKSTWYMRPLPSLAIFISETYGVLLEYWIQSNFLPRSYLRENGFWCTSVSQKNKYQRVCPCKIIDLMCKI